MTYQTFSTNTNANPTSIIIKKSEFIAYAYSVTSREQAMSHVQNLREQYPDARHVCSAYIIGDPNNTTSAGFDDDGEPNGTAGRPILNVLQHKAIGNAVIIVVRYFGGIKLGAGGLTRAYASSAQAIIDKVELVPYIAMSEVRISTDYAKEAQIRYLIDEVNGTINQVDYAETVLVTATIEKQKLDTLKDSLGMNGQLLA
ncbi:MAG: YigZ family protein [Moraxellaceae bacterium]|nr:YigZ family protein [Moraxellaceae bacterium]